jgi:hypothetical protein
MGSIIKIQSISQFHEGIGYDKPKHPLITLIDWSKDKTGSSPVEYPS